MQKPKVALITGASSGIGHATAARLIHDGYLVYVGARRADRMDDLVAQGGIPFKMDVTIEADMINVVEQIEQVHGGVDILINNAGFSLYGPAQTVPIAEARRQFEVNLFGAARLTQLVLPHMLSRKWGKIVNISSVNGRIFLPLGGWYHASKHALEGWSDCLRMEVEPLGVNVILIQPGAVKSEIFSNMSTNLSAYTKDTPYEQYATMMAQTGEEMYGPDGPASDPAVIADVIARALRAKRPQPRYAAGHRARLVLFLRRWLSDRMFERVIRSQY